MDDRERAQAALDATWPGEKRNTEKAVDAIVTALRSAREEQRKRAVEIALTMKGGYKENHCPHCIDGFTAASNIGWQIDKHIACAIESGSERAPPRRGK